LDFRGSLSNGHRVQGILYGRHSIITVIIHEYLIILWHVDPLLGNDREMNSYTTAVARQWLSSDHVGIQTDANATVATATEERRFLCGLCRGVISRTVGAMS
jgi:hypothetical protein